MLSVCAAASGTLEVWTSTEPLVGGVRWIERFPLGLMRDPRFPGDWTPSASQIRPLFTSIRELRICGETYRNMISVDSTACNVRAYGQQ